MLTIVILNILGFLTFPAYYGVQISRTNPLLWVLVPDCQLSALFFGLALFLIIIKKEQKWLTQLGMLSSIKYGLWTLIAMLPNMNYYISISSYFDVYAVIISHVFLLIQTIIIIKKLSFNKQSLPAFIFLILNDASDYLLGTHPYLPKEFIPAMSIITPLITLGLILMAYLFTKSRFFKTSKRVLK